MSATFAVRTLQPRPLPRVADSRHAAAPDSHSRKVAAHAREIAAELGLDEAEQRFAFRCGLLHDIGTIGLLPGLLDKAGPLTSAERAELERHPELGARIVAGLEDGDRLATVVRHHHERVDGGGYPAGLREEEIPLISRILAAADTYNAMTSDRPYRDAMPPVLARARVAELAGTQLDDRVVGAFLRVLDRGEEIG